MHPLGQQQQHQIVYFNLFLEKLVYFFPFFRAKSCLSSGLNDGPSFFLLQIQIAIKEEVLNLWYVSNDTSEKNTDGLVVKI